jgi:hypothetical protein
VLFRFVLCSQSQTIHQKKTAMTLTSTQIKQPLQEKINSNPYLKVSNCTDIADLEYAMDELRKLDAEFGEDNKTLLNLWAKFLNKKKKLR